MPPHIGARCPQFSCATRVHVVTMMCQDQVKSAGSESLVFQNNGLYSQRGILKSVKCYCLIFGAVGALLHIPVGICNCMSVVLYLTFLFSFLSF